MIQLAHENEMDDHLWSLLTQNTRSRVSPIITVKIRSKLDEKKILVIRT